VEHVVLIHGLGGTKSSFYETVSGLAPRYTVHAIDLPGFGASSKSSRAPMTAPGSRAR
jgi:pimeloyl-ACP methyl ester carboxylesterase